MPVNIAMPDIKGEEGMWLLDVEGVMRGYMHAC